MQTMSDGSTAGKLRRPYQRLTLWSTHLSNGAINSFSGAMAGVASGIVTCPLDVIKTKLQAQGSWQSPGKLASGKQPVILYHGMLGTARKIVAEDGFRGLYRGLGPMLLGYLPTWAVYMTVYDSSREWYYAHGYGDGDRNKWVARVYASITAGACSTVATNPIWVIKTRLMSQTSGRSTSGPRTPFHYDNTLDAARKMWKAEGFGVFYAGLGSALLGLSHVAIQFPLYEYFKQEFTGLEMGATPADAASTGVNTVGILAATFLSKICATTATYPHEVLRTRLQTQQRKHSEPQHEGGSSASRPQTSTLSNLKGTAQQTTFKPHYNGIINTFQVILREEGWRAFYSGMGVNLIRAIPAAMTTMLTFESIKSAIGRLQEEGRALKEQHGTG